MAVRRVSRPDEQERGLVLVWTALLLTVLLAMAGFSVDLGSWYARSAQLQRAADAAALAGVVWMPNESAARTAATENLRTNGIIDGQNDIGVDIEPIPPRRLRVTVYDSKVEAYFSKIFINNIQETRRALGEYVLDVPLGSPENSFGRDPTSGSYSPGQGSDPLFYVAVNSYCMSKEDGDLKLSRYDATRPPSMGGDHQCPPTSIPIVDNDDYDPAGYFYDVELPATATQDIYVQAWDASYWPDFAPDRPGGPATASRLNTLFRLWDNTETPLDTTNDPLIASHYAPGWVYGADNTVASSYNATWRTVAVIPASSRAGRYRLQVQTGVNATGNSAPDTWGMNAFSLRASVGPTFSRCSSVPGSTSPPYSASCPQMHGEDAMSVYADATSNSATMYLAELDAIYAGKKVQISLFDPGEGGSSIEILRPTGPSTWAPTSFDWVVDPCPPGFPCMGSGSSLDVSGNLSSAWGNRTSLSKYSDRKVTLTAQIPSDYTGPNGGWWKIRYTFASGGVHDRTTWSVKVLGDPVHLVVE